MAIDDPNNEQPTTWQQRLKAERDELNARLHELDEFLDPSNEKLGELNRMDLYLLYAQQAHMRAYLNVLNQRVSREMLDL